MEVYILSLIHIFRKNEFFLFNNFPVLNNINSDIMIDECQYIQIHHIHITFHLQDILPVSYTHLLATLAVLKSSQTWNDYLWPLIMISNNSRKTVQVALVSTFVTEVSTNWNLLMAGTAIVMLPLVILFLFTQKYFVEGVVSSGIKG